MQEFLATASSGTSIPDVYPWTSGLGFGARFSNPAVGFGGTPGFIQFNNNASVLIANSNSSPGISAYSFGYGFGTKYSDPASPPSSAGYASITPASDAIIVGIGSAPYTIAWAWSPAGFGTRLTDPVGLINTGSPPHNVSPNGNYIAFTQGTSRILAAYAWSASGFGSKFTNSSQLALSSVQGVIRFSNDSTAVAVTHSRSPYITVKGFSASGFGSNFANPTTLPAAGTSGAGLSVRFSPDGNYIAVTGTNSPYLYTYGWSASGFGTLMANPSVLLNATPTLAGEGADWNSSSADIAYYINSSTSPSPLVAYPFSAGYGTQYSAPATRPTFTAAGTASVAFGIAPTSTFLPTTPLAVSVTNPSANFIINRVLTASATSYTATVSNSNFIYRSILSSAEYLSYTSGNNLIEVYNWNSGFGTRTQQGVGPVIYGQLTSNAQYIATTGSTSPCIRVYPFTTTFGTQFADPAAPGTAGYSLQWTSNLNAILTTSNTSPYLHAWAWSPTGFGSKFSNPATIPTTTTIKSSIAPSDKFIVYADWTSFFTTAYKWSASGFGTKYTNSSSFGLSAICRSVAVGPNSDVVAVGHNRTPYVSLFPFDEINGFGVRFPSPSVLPGSSTAGIGWAVKFSNSGAYLTAGTNQSPFVHVYPWTTTGLGTKIANPSLLPNSTADACTWSADDSNIAYAIQSITTPSPLIVYPFTTTFGTRYSAPLVRPNWSSSGAVSFGKQIVYNYPFAATTASATVSTTSTTFNVTRINSSTVTDFNITAQDATLTKTGVAVSYTLTATAGAYAETGQTATLSQTLATLTNYTLTATTSSFSLTGISATLKATRTLTSTLVTYALTETTTSLLYGHKLLSAAQSYSIAETTTGLTSARKLISDTITYTFNVTTTGLTATRLISATQQTYTLTVSNTNITNTRYISAAVQSVIVSSTVSELIATRQLSAAAQTYIVSSTDTSLIYGHLLSATALAYDLTVNTVTLAALRLYTTAAQTYSITGIESYLFTTRKLASDVQTYTLNETDSQLIYAHILATTTQTYTILGSTVNLPAARLLSTTAQAYAYTGTDSQLLYGYRLLAPSSAYATISTDSLLVRGLKLTSLMQAYLQTNNDAVLSVLRLLSAAVQTYSITSIDAALSQTINGTNYTLTATSGSYSQTGQTATLTNTLATVNSYSLTATAVDYLVTVNATNLKINRIISATNTTYTVSSIDTTLKTTRLIYTSVNTYSVDGINAVLKSARTTFIVVTTYVASGVNVTTNVGYKYQASVQNYLLTAQDAILKAHLQLSALTTSYAVATTSTTIISSRIISSSMTACLVATPSTALRIGVSLASDSTSYVYQSYDVGFVLSRNISVTTGHFGVEPSVTNITYQRTFITSTSAISVNPNAVILLSNKTLVASTSTFNCSTTNILLVANRAQAIEFSGLKAKGVGSFITPVSNQIDLADVRFINRRTLVNLYGWGAVDRTLPFDWSESSDTNCPQLGPIDFIHSIYDDVTYQNSNVRWLTRSPGCLEATTAAADALSDDTPIIVPIVHAIADIEKLKSERRTLEAASIEPAALPPAIASNYDININVIEPSTGTEGSILIIDSNTKPAIELPIPVVAAPMPSIAQAIEIIEPQIPALKANHIQLNLNRHYRSDKPSDLAAQNNVIVNPIVVPLVNNAMPVTKPKPPGAPHVNSPVIKNNFNIGHGRPKRKH